MKVTHHKAKSDQRGHVVLDIQTHVPNQLIELVVAINVPLKTKHSYTFQDLAGTVHWHGNALDEQQKLRSEW
jgi:hypothetical protein